MRNEAWPAPRVRGLGRGRQGSREEKVPRAEPGTLLPRPKEMWQD